VQFALGTYVDLDRVHVPSTFGHVTGNVFWQELGNDACGDCVWAGAAHEHMLYALATKRRLPRFTADSVVAEYSKVTGYIPGVPATDQGTDMSKAASYRRKVGLLDAAGDVHKIKAYAEIPIGNVDLLIKATYLFGAVGLGVQIPQSAIDQFDARQPWVPVQGSRNLGGHYVMLCGRNSRGFPMVVTWGRLQAVSAGFIEQYMDEAICYFSREYLTATGKTPELVDEARLDADLATLKSA
jgi:hypothetical protein